MDIKYVANIKTTDAELRGFDELSAEVKDKVLPVFELTKSRKTKLEPYGNVEKRMAKIGELVGERPFILDLTSHDSLINYQIEDLLNPDEGFGNWYDFIVAHLDLNIIPCIHVDVNLLDETTNFVQSMDFVLEKLALRVSSIDIELPDFLNAIGDKFFGRLILIIDALFVNQQNFRDKQEEVLERLKSVNDISSLDSVVIMSSSFPASVVGFTEECKDAEGRFPILENAFVNSVSETVNRVLIHGDYGSVHPFRYETPGGGWVPRIDFPHNSNFYYTRYRRNDGGYAAAAKAMVAKPEYVSFDCWGCREIDDAATGSPNGLSPSYWIAARLNTYVTYQVRNLYGE